MRTRTTSPTRPDGPGLGTHTEYVKELCEDLKRIVAHLKYHREHGSSFTEEAAENVTDAAAVLAEVAAGEIVTPSQLPLGKSLDDVYLLSWIMCMFNSMCLPLRIVTICFFNS